MEALLFVLHVTHGSRLPTGETEPNRGEERSEREGRFCSPADAAASSHTTHVITVSQSGDGESGMAIEKKENGRWIGDQRDAILWG